MTDRARTNPARKDIKELQKVLRLGLTVVTELWSYPAGDWVSSVHAADIDGDGDIEVLLGSRDGNVYCLTKRGILKWKMRISGEWVRAIQGVNNAEAADKTRLILGSRDSKVQAFDEIGEMLWQYQANHEVRQLCIYDINGDGKTEVIVASEDQCIYALTSETGQLLWKYTTGGWVHSIYVADIDQDGEIEILTGSSDKKVRILNHQGECKWKYDAKNEIQVVIAADIDGDNTVEILIATDTKELRVLTLEGKEKWRFQLDNRIHTLTVVDLNNDGHFKVVAGSEDKHLYFLDEQGKLLWRHPLNSRVFSIYATDIDNDGLIEILAGTEDSIHVLRVELMESLRERIFTSHKKLEQTQSLNLGLSSTELALLQDLTNEWTLDEQQLTLANAQKYAQDGNYLQALSVLVLLNQQKVQLLWRQKVGRVRAVFSGDLNNDGYLEIVAGTDDGGVHVFDPLGNEIWSYICDDSIWTVYIGDIDLDGTLEVVAGSGGGLLSVFSNTGEIKWQAHMDDRIESVYINEEKDAEYAEMVIGLRGNQGKIQVYDHHFMPSLEPISTPHGVRIVGTYDLNRDGTAEIIAGGDDDNVYTYRRDGSLLWSYRTGDRARGLVIRDIDADGLMEIVVGSEDRNVHVLDNAGHLKWRYYTPHRVLSVNTLDLDQDGEIEVFLGIDDGYVLFLSKTGDLLWKYKVGDRVCGVQAADCNEDGKVEIIVGSEDRMLYLLQVLSQQEISDEIERCWNALQQNLGLKELLYNLVRSPVPSLRSFALTKFIAQPVLQEEDIAILHELIRDTAGDVRQTFAQEIAAFYQTNPNLSRRFMDILLSDQERDVRLALVDSLPSITQIDDNIGFQYLERFSRSVDAWVRRAIVRKLDLLVEAFPQKVFRLLLNLASDETEWIRQEAARALAHYFDQYEEDLISESRILITQDIDLLILKLIAYCATKTTVRDIFLVAVDMLEKLDESNVLERLENTVKAFEKTRKLNYGEELWQIYYELYRLHRIRTIEEIAHYKCKLAQDHISGTKHLEILSQVLYRLTEVATILATYLKRERLGDRLASLLEATAVIEGISTSLERALSEARVKKSKLPESLILETLLASWRNIVVVELGRLRGKADLQPELRTKLVPNENQVGIWLDIRNEGRSPADNLVVKLQPSNDFRIIGKSVREFETVSASDSVIAEFTIRPLAPLPRLAFDLVYADAESREKTLTFGDCLEVREFKRKFTRIPNPYSVGTPIQTSDMFYGREKDLAILREDLTNVSANLVVVLYGQRRSGKSSLLYQLLNTASLDPHIPVYIDMQHETLNMSTSQFLYHLAVAIYRNVKEKNFEIAPPNVKDFREDPTLAFDLFLDTVESVRKNQKLIIMIDEFEILEQKVAEKVLAEEFFEYLRSLMQHRQGINFLLAGTHTIEHLTQEYWSVFFNIARHHRLSRLSAEAGRQLITRPAVGYLEYDPLAVEKISQLAADQPYFIQLICRSLIAHCNEVQKSYITINDVNLVQNRVMETGQVHFKWLWGQTSLEERLVLSIMAQEGGDEGRSLSLKDIEEVYQNYGLPYNHVSIMEALEKLIDKDIVDSVSEGTRFKILIGLTRRWLRDTKSLKRVMMEENLFTS